MLFIYIIYLIRGGGQRSAYKITIGNYCYFNATIYMYFIINATLFNYAAAAVAQSVRAFASHVEGLVFESQPRHPIVVKTGSDRCECHGSPKKTIIIGCPVSH